MSGTSFSDDLFVRVLGAKSFVDIPRAESLALRELPKEQKAGVLALLSAVHSLQGFGGDVSRWAIATSGSRLVYANAWCSYERHLAVEKEAEPKDLAPLRLTLKEHDLYCKSFKTEIEGLFKKGSLIPAQLEKAISAAARAIATWHHRNVVFSSLVAASVDWPVGVI
jgi:hypothetical protein